MDKVTIINRRLKLLIIYIKNQGAAEREERKKYVKIASRDPLVIMIKS